MGEDRWDEDKCEMKNAKAEMKEDKLQDRWEWINGRRQMG